MLPSSLDYLPISLPASIPHTAARASILKWRFHHGFSLPSMSSQHLNVEIQIPLHSYGVLYEVALIFQPLATSSLLLCDLPCRTSFTSLNLSPLPPPLRSLYTWFHLFWNMVFLLSTIYRSTNNSGLDFSSLFQDYPLSLVSSRYYKFPYHLALCPCHNTFHTEW